jgi:hypothetical protein
MLYLHLSKICWSLRKHLNHESIHKVLQGVVEQQFASYQEPAAIQPNKMKLGP